MNHKKYFEFFTRHCNDRYDLFIKMKIFIEEEIANAKGTENAKAYTILTSLSDSENNAGWERRHDARITAINKAKGDIIDTYEQYLP
jgi:hypothetical protein